MSVPCTCYRSGGFACVAEKHEDQDFQALRRELAAARAECERLRGGAAEVRAAALEEKAARIYAIYEQLHTPGVVMSKDLFWATLDKAVERAHRTALEESQRAIKNLPTVAWFGSHPCINYLAAEAAIRTLAASQTPPGGSDGR